MPIVVRNAEATLARCFGELRFHWVPPRHLLFFTAPSLVRLAGRCGYRILARRAYEIDEIVTSAFRWTLIRTGPGRRGEGDPGAGRPWLGLLGPKGPLAALSSAAMYPPLADTPLGCLPARTPDADAAG